MTPIIALTSLSIVTAHTLTQHTDRDICQLSSSSYKCYYCSSSMEITLHNVLSPCTTCYVRCVCVCVCVSLADTVTAQFPLQDSWSNTAAQGFHREFHTICSMLSFTCILLMLLLYMYISPSFFGLHSMKLQVNRLPFCLLTPSRSLLPKHLLDLMVLYISVKRKKSQSTLYII